jgi:hypothetical protein
MHYRVIGVAETWGWRCDGFLTSTATIDDPTEPGFPALICLTGRKNTTICGKDKEYLVHMYDHYFDDYDTFTYLATIRI